MSTASDEQVQASTGRTGRGTVSQVTDQGQEFNGIVFIPPGAQSDDDDTTPVNRFLLPKLIRVPNIGDLIEITLQEGQEWKEDAIIEKWDPI
ncbi:MAG: hypothetical protein AAGN35_22920 [Bacteroidota bacterium]